jgi:hypothetical protein
MKWLLDVYGEGKQLLVTGMQSEGWEKWRWAEELRVVELPNLTEGRGISGGSEGRGEALKNPKS